MQGQLSVNVLIGDVFPMPLVTIGDVLPMPLVTINYHNL